MILIHFRHKLSILFPTIIGMLLFILRVNHNVFRIMCCIGISISKSMVLFRLHELVNDSQFELDAWVRESPTKALKAQVVFDNLNKMSRAWDPTVGHQDIVHCGTSAILIKLESVSNGALDLEPLLQAIREQHCSSLIVDILAKDIDWTYIHVVGKGLIFCTILKHVPTLSRHPATVEALFIEHHKKHQLALHKSDVRLCRCSGINESTTVRAGAIQALYDVVDGQIKLSDHRKNNFILIAGSDQLSMDRVRKGKRALEKGKDNAESAQYLREKIELWHMKYNFGKSIVRTHWDSSPPGAFGLQADCTRLNRKFNPIKCDFYPMHQLLEVRFEALVLEAVRCAIHSTAESLAYINVYTPASCARS